MLSPTQQVPPAIKHVPEDDLFLFLAERLPQEQSARVCSHLCSCPSCRSSLQSVLRFGREQDIKKDGTEGSRIEPRYKTNFAGKLRLLSPFAADCLEVIVRDMSSAGLQVQSPRELYVGALVQVRAQRLITLGEVRYCHRIPGGKGFHAGIQAHVIHVCPERYPSEEEEVLLH